MKGEQNNCERTIKCNVVFIDGHMDWGAEAGLCP